MIPTSIDGTDITGATIDGTDVQEITVDGQTVFTAEFFEGFEDGNINEYQGNTNAFTVQSNTVFEGNFALENVIEYNTIYRQDAMSPGDKAEVFVRAGVPQFWFGYDGSVGYLASANTFQNDITIFRYENNNLTPIGTGPATLPSNQFIKFIIEYFSPNINFRVEDLSGNTLGSTSVTDSTHTETGFGFRGQLAFYDSLTIS